MPRIAAVSRPFEALGYRPAAAYDFPDKHLTSLHFANVLTLKTCAYLQASKVNGKPGTTRHRPMLLKTKLVGMTR